MGNQLYIVVQWSHSLNYVKGAFRWQYRTPKIQTHLNPLPTRRNKSVATLTRACSMDMHDWLTSQTLQQARWRRGIGFCKWELSQMYSWECSLDEGHRVSEHTNLNWLPFPELTGASPISISDYHVTEQHFWNLRAALWTNTWIFKIKQQLKWLS